MLDTRLLDPVAEAILLNQARSFYEPDAHRPQAIPLNTLVPLRYPVRVFPQQDTGYASKTNHGPTRTRQIVTERSQPYQTSRPRATEYNDVQADPSLSQMQTQRVGPPITSLVDDSRDGSLRRKTPSSRRRRQDRGKQLLPPTFSSCN